MTLTPLFNERHEHVVNVRKVNIHAYNLEGVDKTNLSHIYRRVDYDGLIQFKKDFNLITQREFEDEQTSIFDYL